MGVPDGGATWPVSGQNQGERRIRLRVVWKPQHGNLGADFMQVRSSPGPFDVETNCVAEHVARMSAAKCGVSAVAPASFSCAYPSGERDGGVPPWARESLL